MSQVSSMEAMPSLKRAKIVLKEDDCTFLYAGTFFLKETFLVKRWRNYEGKYVSLRTISLDEDLKIPRWDTFTRSIKKDKIFDNGEFGHFESVAPCIYWFRFFRSDRIFSRQTLKDISNLLTVTASIEDVEECRQHGSHTELKKYFFDDGADRANESCCALKLHENAWSKRLVESLNECSYDYLNGWQSVFWGTKADELDFNEIQQEISGISIDNAKSAYVYHGAPDILITRNSQSTPLIVSQANDLENVPRVLENSRQPLQVCLLDDIYMPQKLGEVIAQAHFIASATFLCCGRSGNMPSTLESKGLLIDKVTGGYHVSLLAQINSTDTDAVPLYVILKRQKTMGTLREGLLCEHLKRLVQHE